MSGVFFLLLLRGIQRVSGVSLDKISSCPYKPETVQLSLWIYISDLSGQGEYLAGITPYTISIPCKNKRRKTPDTSIIRKEPIREPVNPRKREKEDIITDVEKASSK